jgi:hypothetical protein
VEQGEQGLLAREPKASLGVFRALANSFLLVGAEALEAAQGLGQLAAVMPLSWLWLQIPLLVLRVTALSALLVMVTTACWVVPAAVAVAALE